MPRWRRDLCFCVRGVVSLSIAFILMVVPVRARAEEPPCALAERETYVYRVPDPTVPWCGLQVDARGVRKIAAYDALGLGTPTPMPVVVREGPATVWWVVFSVACVALGGAAGFGFGYLAGRASD